MNQRSAFTLIELAIALVIIALLVGGVMTGQTLMRAAELQSVGAEAEKFNRSVSAFRDKYLNLPGDMSNAQSFWGILDPTAATCDATATPSGSTATCNGGGDKQVGLSDGTGFETFRFWQHLANAGMIEGRFTGTSTNPPGYQVQRLTNVPGSRNPQGAWCARFRSSGGGSGVLFDETSSNHMFAYGSDSDSTPCQAPVISPIDALSLDIKIDDGKPAAGNLQAAWRSTCANSSASNDFSASYRGTVSTIACALFFRKAF